MAHDAPNVFDFGKGWGFFLSDYDGRAFLFSIVRAFLIEEQRIVAMVMKSKKGAAPTEVAAVAQVQTTGSKAK